MAQAMPNTLVPSHFPSRLIQRPRIQSRRRPYRQKFPPSRAPATADPPAFRADQWRQRVPRRIRTSLQRTQNLLFRTPPKCPQFNGCVERANDATRVASWNQCDGEFIAEASDRALADY